MSLVSMIFNRGVGKFLLALSIPLGIVYFFWYSQHEATEAIKQLKIDQKAHPTVSAVTINNYEMKEVDDGNHIRWQLTSRVGVLNPNGKDVELADVVVNYFDATTHALKMKMVAPIGHANQATKFVKLTGDKTRRVVADGGGFRPSHFECGQVELIKQNEFLASGGVIIDWPGVAKVSGSLAAGSTDMSSGPKNLKVVGNTHATIGAM